MNPKTKSPQRLTTTIRACLHSKSTAPPPRLPLPFKIRSSRKVSDQPSRLILPRLSKAQRRHTHRRLETLIVAQVSWRKRLRSRGYSGESPWAVTTHLVISCRISSIHIAHQRLWRRRIRTGNYSTSKQTNIGLCRPFPPVRRRPVRPYHRHRAVTAGTKRQRIYYRYPLLHYIYFILYTQLLSITSC